MGRRRRSAHRARVTRATLSERLLALPWVTFVLVVLVAGGVAGLLRPTIFEARSTVTASTAEAATEAASSLTDADLALRVEDQVELAPELRRSVRIAVERPGQRTVVVRAQAPDARLAAVAADTAAALVVEEDDELSLTEAAVVPTAPLDGGSAWPWTLAGAVLLALALVVERRHDRRGLAEQEHVAESHGVPAGGPR